RVLQPAAIVVARQDLGRVRIGPPGRWFVNRVFPGPFAAPPTRPRRGVGNEELKEAKTSSDGVVGSRLPANRSPSGAASSVASRSLNPSSPRPLRAQTWQSRPGVRPGRFIRGTPSAPTSPCSQTESANAPLTNCSSSLNPSPTAQVFNDRSDPSRWGTGVALV